MVAVVDVVVVDVVVDVVDPAVVVVAEEAPEVLVDNDLKIKCETKRISTKRHAIEIRQLEFVKPI